MHLHHIAIVVDDIKAAVRFWHDALGLPVSRIEHNAEESVQIAFLPLGDLSGNLSDVPQGEIELIAPTDSTTGVARYLATRGAGLHHLCLEVADLDAKIEALKAAGVELINDQPKQNADGRRYCFVHPRSTFGVLLELYEKLYQK